jgi:hypothetical protein
VRSSTGPFAFEIRRQILVGIAVALGAGNPDLFCSKALAEFTEHTDLVSNAIDLRYAVVFTLDDDCPPEFRHDAV